MEVCDEKKLLVFMEKEPILSTSSANARKKVILKPGRSLMDWIRLTKSGKDLAGTGGRCLEVSSKELAKHNTPKDAWIALKGRVYNVTHYLEFHPGGEDELLRGIGADATDLFNQVHQWVNAESMLEKCFVGILRKSWTFEEKVSNFKPLRFLKLKSKSLAAPGAITDPATSTVDKEKCDVSVKSDWPSIPSESNSSDMPIRFTEDGNFVKISIDDTSIKSCGLITDLVKRKLFIKYKQLLGIFLTVDFPFNVKDSYEVKLTEESMDILMTCTDKVMSCSSKNSAETQLPSWNINTPKLDCIYWSCKLIGKSQINHNTYLFTFLLPSGTKMWIPIGCHVKVKCFVKSEEIIRSYTPVYPLFIDKVEYSDKLDSSKVFLLIKIYPKGKMSQILNNFSLGDSVLISNFLGSFSLNQIKNSDNIIILAAGTGITPMIRIINWIMTTKDKKRSLSLLFFNKTKDDILWMEDIDKFKSSHADFQVFYILSEPDKNWKGFKGQLDENLLKKLLSEIKHDQCRRILICGPQPFTESALKCIDKANLNLEEVFTFSG